MYIGLIEEKRWMISPSIVFKLKDLESHRLNMGKYLSHVTYI